MIRILFFISFLMTTLFASEVEFFKENGFLDDKSANFLIELGQTWPQQYSETITRLDKLYQQYEREKGWEGRDNSEERIAAVVHLIWIGPNSFPDTEVLYQWRAHNPNYRLVLWTDRVRTLIEPLVEQRRIETLFPLKLQRQLEASISWAEKADLLRYEILERFGGIYADVDFFCEACFDDLIHNYDFFCGLEPVGTFIDRRCTRVGNCLIGCVAHHPLMIDTIDRIERQWDKTSRFVTDYSWRFRADENINLRFALIIMRTFLPFTDAVFAKAECPRCIVFPATYFGLVNQSYKYGYHQFCGTWIDRKQPFNADNLQTVYATYRTLGVAIVLLAMAFGLSTLAMVVFYRKNRKRVRERSSSNLSLP